MVLNLLLSNHPEGASASEEENLEKYNAEPSDWLSEGAHQVNVNEAVDKAHSNGDVA
jgi:hypothetical protein